MADSELILVAAAIGATAAIISSLVSTHFSNRAADSRLRIQLYHENQQNAMRYLYDSLSNIKTYDELSQKTNTFLDGFEGQQLPQLLRNEIRSKVHEYWEYLCEHFPELYGEASDEEIEEFEKSRENSLMRLTSIEREEEFAREKLEVLVGEIKRGILDFATGKRKTT
jgi:hypothetical protein